MKTISELLKEKGRIFIIPLDHPPGEDTAILEKIGIQKFVDSIDKLKHEG